MTETAKPAAAAIVSENMMSVYLLIVEQATENFWRATFLRYGVLMFVDCHHLSMKAALAAGCDQAVRRGVKEFGVRIVAEERKAATGFPVQPMGEGDVCP